MSLERRVTEIEMLAKHNGQRLDQQEEAWTKAAERLEEAITELRGYAVTIIGIMLSGLITIIVALAA